MIRQIKEYINKKKAIRKEKKRVAKVLKSITDLDKQRLASYAGILRPQECDAIAYAIGMEYHRLEKGITMPNRRLGFGQPIVLKIIVLIRRYVRNGGKITDFEPHHALCILAEYKKIHEEAQFELEEQTKRALHNILTDYPVSHSQQLKMTPEKLWNDIHSDFATFSASRHSVRHVKGKVPTENIIKAVSLACNSPSACNRQYVKVKLVEDYNKIQSLLELQNGNKGFGHLVEQLLLITVDLSAIRWLAERHDIFTNAGIFIMNLCYALHYHKIAHCMLNWSEGKVTDDELRKRITIPEQETVVLMIMLGDVPDEFMVTSSPRRTVDELFTIIK